MTITTATSNATEEGEEEETPSSSSSLPLHLQNLQGSIAQFSDGNLFIPSKDALVEESSILRRYAPPGLEEQFQQLYGVLLSNLYHPEDTSTTSTATMASSSSAAILMGAKGSGKSLLLERCLAACQEQHRQQAFHTTKNNDNNSKQQQKASSALLYRQVSINGILCRGQDVGAVVYEMIRQLSEIAFYGNNNHNYYHDEEQEGDGTTSPRTVTEAVAADAAAAAPLNAASMEPDGQEEDPEEMERKRRKRLKRDKHLLRLRRSSFTSNVALLEATLKLAHADDIPILLILDELDAFLEEGERQMLLYYFLDRVATPGSNIIFIGSTSSFSTLTLLEKRIRSRAEGTAKVIYLRNPPTYGALVKVLQHKLKDCVVGNDIVARISCVSSIANDEGAADQATGVIPEEDAAAANNDQADSGAERAAASLNSALSQDERGEAGQISVAMEREFRLGKDVRWYSRVMSTALSLYRFDCRMEESNQVKFHTKYLLEALVMMGASIGDVADSASKQPDLSIVNGRAVDPRLQAMLNMSTPQVVLLLSARRILTRQSHNEDSMITAPPLTLDRMMKEYESFRRRSNAAQFNNVVLRKAMLELMDVGLIMPASDHSGGGPLQYNHSKSHRNLDTNGLTWLRLQIPLDMEREMGKALEQNLLNCPTALKEWGKATT